MLSLKVFTILAFNYQAADWSNGRKIIITSLAGCLLFMLTGIQAVCKAISEFTDFFKAVSGFSV